MIQDEGVIRMFSFKTCAIGITRPGICVGQGRGAEVEFKQNLSRVLKNVSKLYQLEILFISQLNSTPKLIYFLPFVYIFLLICSLFRHNRSNVVLLQNLSVIMLVVIEIFTILKHITELLNKEYFF